MLKSDDGRDSKNIFVTLFQFLPIKSYTGVNIDIYISSLIGNIHQIWFSFTKSINLLGFLVELEPNSEVPSQFCMTLLLKSIAKLLLTSVDTFFFNCCHDFPDWWQSKKFLMTYKMPLFKLFSL